MHDTTSCLSSLRLFLKKNTLLQVCETFYTKVKFWRYAGVVMLPALYGVPSCRKPVGVEEKARMPCTRSELCVYHT